MALFQLVPSLVFPRTTVAISSTLRRGFGNTSVNTSLNPAKNQTKDVSNNNSSIQPTFHNRNPRNLEKLCIARKPQGYHLNVPGHEFWHKLVLKTSRSKLTAEVVHNSGTTVISASTTECGFKKYLYRPTDTAAHKALGKILARRCLESGISAIMCDLKPEEGSKVDVLLREAQEGGLSLSEPKHYKNPIASMEKHSTKLWEVIS